jgi:hypothetical protein
MIGEEVPIDAPAAVVVEVIQSWRQSSARIRGSDRRAPNHPLPLAAGPSPRRQRGSARAMFLRAGSITVYAYELNAERIAERSRVE